MFPFIETIKIEGGKIYNLSFHNDRANETRRTFFGNLPAIDLVECINPESFRLRYRCRVEYAENVINVEYFPYHIRPVAMLKLVKDDSIDYSYKSSDRDALNRLFDLRGITDDVLIVRNGLLTDTSIANIALRKGKDWFTPACPLLKGTKRRELLEKGIIKEGNIRIEELNDYTEICLFNAMIEFEEIKLPITNIFK